MPITIARSHGRVDARAAITDWQTKSLRAQVHFLEIVQPWRQQAGGGTRMGTAKKRSGKRASQRSWVPQRAAKGSRRAFSAVHALPSNSEFLSLLARLGVKAFARHLGMSESTLRRELRAQGERVRALVNEWRRRTARSSLEDNVPLGALARNLGFSGVSALSGWVSTSFGLSPVALRRSLHEATIVEAFRHSGQLQRLSQPPLTENVEPDRKCKLTPLPIQAEIMSRIFRGQRVTRVTSARPTEKDNH